MEQAGHASVYLVPDPDEPLVKHHVYRVKELLGVLKGSASLRSELYLCFLHAATPHFLADTLTGYTGTEKALQILRSDLVRSLARASRPHAGSALQILHQIGSLSPKRRYFPIRDRRVQMVKWSQIPLLAQSDELYVAAQEIITEALDFESCFRKASGV